MGREYAIYYFSRKLKGAEVHYTITEKECLAVVTAVKHFRIYLFNEFTVVTDHQALKWLLNKTDLSGRNMRWSLYLQPFNFTIVHRPGRVHKNADALSRVEANSIQIAACSMQDRSTNTDENSNIDLDPYEDALLLNFLKSGRL